MSMTRTEHDLLGDREIPAEAYYGVHTLRAQENFQITGQDDLRLSGLVIALASVKQAAARGQCGAGLLRRRSATPSCRLRGDPRGRAARPVRRRRDPGRRRHVDQHERQRGDLPIARWRSWGTRAASTSTCIRTKTSTWRRAPTTSIRPRCASHRASPSSGCSSAMDRPARRLRGEGRRVRGRAEDRPHPAAGRGADDARPGVLDLRGDGRARTMRGCAKPGR